ncbi:MAG TPA: uridine diphosphate-N-acetylglucosamine-binding protein YvcK [Thermoanaerobaculia bacterium]|nr:uridine diphosphate-N-acetylglucosamine-binding protein YvcK [Thermoanaerobaculia bacterium]
MPSTTPTSPRSARTATSASSSASPEREKDGGGKRLVAVGGGTGLSALLRGLKHYAGSDRLRQLTGVVTVTDDGGSSGRLRREFGVLPPGDIRNCLVALADDEDLLARLFQYRFPNGDGLLGHSFGNLFLTALTGITGDFHQAILTAESILSVRGKICPATVQDVRLRGRGASGQVYEGESAIGTSGEAIERLDLDPPAPPAFPPAVTALEKADLILLGPGSLYTSILPNLLIPGIRQAVNKSPARTVLLLNLMTQPGETDGMTGLDHLRAIERFAGRGLVDAVLVSSSEIPGQLLEHYAETGSEPVLIDRAEVEALGIRVVEADLLAPGDEFIRHDPPKLAEAVMELLDHA